MHAMLFYSSDQPELYHGRNLDAAYHRFAHRHRDRAGARLRRATCDRRCSGGSPAATSRATRGYEGPGEGTGNVIVPRIVLRARTRLRRSRQRLGACRRVDDVPRANAAARIHVPLHAGRAAAAARIRASCALADNVHSNPGPGRALPVFVTQRVRRRARRRRSTSGVRGRGASTSSAARRSGRAGASTGSTTAAGRQEARSRSMRPPPTRGRRSGPRSSTTCACTSTGTPCTGGTIRRSRASANQNVWANSITFDNRGQPNKPIDDQGYIHGDGVLLYPGEEKLHPEEDRGIPGPIATIQLANFRRGLQDHQYLTLARRLGLTELVDARFRRSCRACSPTPAQRVSFPETGDPYDAARLKLARAIAAARHADAPRPALRQPVLFDTPEADRILRALQIFPPDNPWHEDISARPLDPQSAAIVASHRRGQAARLQPRHELRDRARLTSRESPCASRSTRTNPIPARFPIPANAPIENWPLARNEDAGALPQPGHDAGAVPAPRHGRSAPDRRRPGERHAVTSSGRRALQMPAGRRRRHRTFDLHIESPAP